MRVLSAGPFPQYNVGYGRYRELMADLERQAPGLFLAGHYRDGISLSDSIVSGCNVAERVGPRRHSARRCEIHEAQGRPAGQPGFARLALGAGRAALPARVPDGWPGAGRELVRAVLHRPFCHPALAPEAVRRGLPQDLDAAGSPLVVISRQVQAEAASSAVALPVELAMRYQNPSIPDAVRRLAATGRRRGAASSRCSRTTPCRASRPRSSG